MAKIIFSIKYDIFSEKRNEYLSVIRELKNIIKIEGMENYSAYQVKGKQNRFKEIYIYSNEKAWEEADDSQDERVDILMNKLSDMIIEKSTNYETLIEIEE